MINYNIFKNVLICLLNQTQLYFRTFVFTVFANTFLPRPEFCVKKMKAKESDVNLFVYEINPYIFIGISTI